MLNRVLAAGVVLAVAAAAGCATAPPRPYAQPEKAESKPPVEVGDQPDRPVSPLPSPSVAGTGIAVAGKGGANDLTIQPDSLVRVSVAEDPGLDGGYPVNDIGAIQLGYIGPVILFNHTEKQAEEKIAAILKTREFRNATVSVRILRASYDKIRVEGAVNHPGLIRIGSGDRISLNDALLQAGGLKASAKDVKVRIVRGGLMTAVAFDLPGEEYDLIDAEGSPNVPRIALKNNDLAYVYGLVEKKPGEVLGGAGGERRITLLGEVNRQGVFIFQAWEPCTMMHLMFKINGLPPYANRKAIRVVRADEAGRESEFEVNIDAILKDGDPSRDFPLDDGDRVIVPARRISIF